jgi:hypothetical protein
MLRLITILSFMVLAFACGGDGGVGRDGPVVGGPCTSSGDCEFRCEMGGEFPQGTCIKPCNTDDDCPDNFLHQPEGGICLLGCKTVDCRGYNCEGRRTVVTAVIRSSAATDRRRTR